MTRTQIRKLGLSWEASRSGHGYTFGDKHLQLEIERHHTIEDVLEMIYDEGVKQGVVEGKAQRSKEIREIFGF